MKISQMNTEQFIHAACDLMEPIDRIVHCPELVELLSGLSKGVMEGELPLAYLIRNLSTAFPALMKNHLDDVLAVLSVLTEKTAADLRNQSIVFTAQQVNEYIIQDLKALLPKTAA